MEMAISLQDDSRTLQYEQGVAKQKMIKLEMDARVFNVKTRGMPEKAELNSDLQAFIADWLASKLHLEEEIAPCLTRAHRIEHFITRNNKVLMTF